MKRPWKIISKKKWNKPSTQKALVLALLSLQFISFHPSSKEDFFCNTNDTYVLFGSILFVGEIDKMFHFVINAGSLSVLLGVVVTLM